MGTTHTENFAGASGTLEGAAPTTGSGTWAMASANTSNYRITRNGSGLGSGSGSGHKAAYLNAGAADHYAGMEYHGANANYGAAVRVVDHNNVIALRRWTGTIMQLIKRVGGTQTTVASISGLDTWVEGDVFGLEATGSDPVNVKVFKNGDPIGNPDGYNISDAVFSGVTNVGIWGADASASASMDNWEGGTLVSDTLTIGVGPASRQILQRPPSGDFALSLSGTFAGATPDDIEWRLEDQSGQLKSGYDWTSAAATIGAGTWSLTVDVPADTDLGGYILKLRSVDSGSAVLAATQTNGFTVGDIWIGIGQSNMAGLFSATGGAAPANVGAVYDPSTATWGVGSARIGYFLNALSALAGVPQGVCSGLGVNATGIRYHCPAHTSTDGSVPEGTNWPNIEDAVLALGDVRGELRVIGENDAGSGLAKQRQKDAFTAIRAALKTLTGRGDAAFATLVMVTGRDDGGSGTDSGWQAVREAQAEWCAATDGAHVAGDGITLPMADNLHYNTAGYVEMARRFARTAAKVLGGSAYDARGPIVSGASIAGSTVTVAFDLNGASALTGSGTLDGWEYYDGSAWSGATDAARSGNTVTFTGAGAAQVRYLYGADPEVANVVRGDVGADASSPDHLPAEPTRGAVEVRQPVALSPASITATSALGVPTLDVQRSLAPAGLVSETGMAAGVLAATRALGADNVVSETALGGATITATRALAAASLVSPAALAAAALAGGRALEAAGLASAAGLGVAAIAGTRSLAAASLISGVTLASPGISGTGVLAPDGLGSSAALASAGMTAVRALTPAGLLSSTAMAAAEIAAVGALLPAALASAAAVGSPTMTKIGALAPHGIASVTLLGGAAFLGVGDVVVPERLTLYRPARSRTLRRSGRRAA